MTSLFEPRRGHFAVGSLCGAVPDRQNMWLFDRNARKVWLVAGARFADAASSKLCPRQPAGAPRRGRNIHAVPSSRQQRRAGTPCAEKEDAARGCLPRDGAQAILREAIGAHGARTKRGGAPATQARAQAGSARRPDRRTKAKESARSATQRPRPAGRRTVSRHEPHAIRVNKRIVKSCKGKQRCNPEHYRAFSSTRSVCMRFGFLLLGLFALFLWAFNFTTFFWARRLAGNRHARSEIAIDEIVRALAAAGVDLDCRRQDHFAVRIEGGEKIGRITAGVGCEALERVCCDEERHLHGTIVAPEPHRTTRRIEDAALIGKAQRHWGAMPRLRCRSHHELGSHRVLWSVRRDRATSIATVCEGVHPRKSV